ncbi:MAG: thiamine-phosphate diphosphorylase [Candidatus Firestonebacteria bacterium RIFOXYA2_FULL_40_8]|nr:MAG: thiamine-phosphate diphosphorylase [Candidatus Firestonebacteria bacterium RIFOXYA2_FULL_40_8]
MFSLCFVTDRKALGKVSLLPGVVKSAVAGGVDAVILREKDIENTALLLLLAKKIKKAAGKAVFIVNGRCDIALAAGADGVHLTASSIAVKDARKILGKAKLIGKSCHSLKDAKKACNEGADYIFVGPVFFTASKAKYGKPLGYGIISKIKKSIKIPVLGIGGIKKDNAETVMKTGADGVAVITGILKAKKPKKEAELYRGVIDGFRK